jgi:hypothetical protein
MDRHIILGVHITDRVKHAPQVQQVLTESGCAIRTRLGLHETGERSCSPNGVLILEMLDDQDAVDRLRDALAAIEGVEIKEMIFDHA